MANGTDIGPGTTRQQRHYRNGGKERRAEWRRRPEVAEKLRADRRRYVAENPDKIKAQNADYKTRCGDKKRAQNRLHRRRKLGLPEPTRPEPAACECCGRSTKIALSLDHCHETGKFRGWLCYSCNSALGKLGDNSLMVARAVAYLIDAERHTGLIPKLCHTS